MTVIRNLLTAISICRDTERGQMTRHAPLHDGLKRTAMRWSNWEHPDALLHTWHNPEQRAEQPEEWSGIAPKGKCSPNK